MENYNEVKLCPAEGCPLHPFRTGKNPYRAKPSEKQIEAAKRNAERYFASNSPKTPEGKTQNDVG